MGFGESSDPTVIQGALAEASIPLQPFKVTFNKDALVLTHPSGKQKTIGLSESGIEITVEGTQPFQETIPFVLSLDNLSPTQWASTLTPTCQEHTCSFATSGGSVVMGFNADSMSIRSCLDSAAFITSPEIPDRNYPPGHFLPFPLAVLDLSANDFLKVTVFEMSK